jgi:hypothetical protein
VISSVIPSGGAGSVNRGLRTRRPRSTSGGGWPRLIMRTTGSSSGTSATAAVMKNSTA